MASMIALLPKDPEPLAVGDEKLLHVTMCFLGKKPPEAAAKAVEEVSNFLPIRARVAGVGRLGSEDPPATVLFLNGGNLAEAREKAQVKGAPAQFEPFIAHMTIGYGTPLSKVKHLMGREIVLDRVALVEDDKIKAVGGVKDMAKAHSYDPGMDDLTITGQISKVDDDHRQVFGWASVTELNGEPVVDLQNDYLETMELEKAAYDYVLHSRVGGEMHQRVGKSSPKQVGTLIESMVLTPEKIEKMGLPDSTPRGWWIGFQIAKDETGDEVWKAVKDKKYTGFSIHGMGKRLEKSLDEIGKALEDEQPTTARDVRTQFLVAKALERSSTRAEFAEHVDEIAKALVDVDEDLAQDFDTLHKHLIGSHEQKDHDPTKGKGHSRKEHQTFEGAMEGFSSGAGAGLIGGAGAGALMGGAPGAVIGSGAAIPGSILGGLVGAVAGARKGGKEAEARHAKTKHEARTKGLPKGATGDILVDAQKFGPFSSQEEVLADYEDWATKKYGSMAGGSSEAAQYMQDRGFWPKTTTTKKNFTDRQREVLAKYLGPLDEESSDDE